MAKVHRHHKRTPYSSNSFPVESYQWNCDDQGLYFYGQPFNSANKAADAYWKEYISPTNPFVPSGWIGTCQFPQITAPGLDDSWQHGADLYALYHDTLGFLPGRDEDWRSKVTYRVTTNVITSQVAGMVINAMWGTTDSVPIVVQASSVDSLEPTYSCGTASNLFNAIKSSSNPAWAAHLSAASSLYATLDGISGVSPTDGGFHASFDHYYDNLSARQCHSKPLPCKLVNGANSTTCVTQVLADEVYRFGNWEYSQIYRDSPSSLAASAASYGVWVAELATHLRAVINGTSSTLYYHNIAHDGSVSRLLSVLQIDTMVWPGMGSEVVFELYKKTASTATSATSTKTSCSSATTTTTQKCNHDNCLRQLLGKTESASAFCPTFTASASATALPAWINNCGADPSRVSSACSCVVTPSAAATGTTMSSAPAGAGTGTSAPTSPSGHYVRVLFGGQVLKSSNPSLGLIDMLPAETLLAYFDGLAGPGASLVVQKCNS